MVEAAYALEGDDEAWLRRIAEPAHQLLGSGCGMAAFTVDTSDPSQPRIETLVTLGPPEVERLARGATRAADPGQIEHTMHRTGCITVSQLLGGPAPQIVEFGAKLGVVDVLGVNSYEPDGSGTTLAVPLAEVTSVPARVAWLWNRVAAHIAAGRRLRRRLPASPELDTADAVLEPNGKVAHAQGPAKARKARDTLREAAARFDRARLRGTRSDADTALDLWRGLVDGCWSLVDSFDSDGRRLIVARKNHLELPDPRALTRCERVVAVYASIGHSNKMIAYELGMSPSSVSRHLARATRKLGCHTRSDLIRMLRRIPNASEP